MNAGGRPKSARGQQVLTYMREFFVRNDQLPPARLIAEHFGWASINAAHSHIRGLVKAGQIERNEAGRYRFARSVR